MKKQPRKFFDRSRFALVCIALLVTLTSAGCSDANDTFIRGSWYYRDAHLDSVPGETYLEISWTFDQGAFEFHSCCFSGESHLAGRYRIVDSKKDVITLELFNIRGDGTTRGGEIRIVLDREGDTLNIQGGGPFIRSFSSIKSGFVRLLGIH